MVVHRELGRVPDHVMLARVDDALALFPRCRCGQPATHVRGFKPSEGRHKMLYQSECAWCAKAARKGRGAPKGAARLAERERAARARQAAREREGRGW